MGILIIAEAGVNHNGDLEAAEKLVEVAVRAGADAVKFQTFVPEEVASSRAQKAAYQKVTTDPDETQLDMIRKFALGKADFVQLAKSCAYQKIEFLSTPFDIPSISFLANELGLHVLKLPSGEITNGPFLLAAAQTNRDLIISTGMSTLDEIKAALSVVCFGFLNLDTEPSRDAFDLAFESEQAQALLREKVTLLHCTSQYPTPLENVNLQAMDTLRQTFGLRVGYSDHTLGITTSIAAAARGAQVIEKHFTLDKAMPGPDHQASLDPDELSEMVAKIRETEILLGSHEKAPSTAELDTRAVARKSLVATQSIAVGEIFSPDNLGFKRPGVGVSPMQFWKLLGKPASASYEADELIKPI
jgi:N-acetylneuraminate synthase